MIIREVNIKSFGKLQNRTFTFSDGINVIYGENEAGKSTLQQFIKAMLFGLDKKRGRALEDEYQKYEPWDSPAHFAGSLVFETGGQKFLLERNFYHKENTVRLINIGDLEELSVEKGDLAMLLGNVSKSAYENTYCISQAKQLPHSELGTMLADERTNLTQTKDASFQLSHALDKLEQKKKQFAKEKKELEQRRISQIEQLKSQQRLLEVQMGQQYEKVSMLKGQEMQLEQKMREAKAKEQAIDAPKKTDTQTEVASGHDMKKQWNPLVIIGVVGVLFMQLLNTWQYLPLTPCRILQVVCVVVMITGIAQTIRRNAAEDKAKYADRQRNYREETEQRQFYQDEQKKYYTEYRQVQITKETLEQELQEQEVLLENNRQQQEELEQLSQEERELLHELDALHLATDTMQQIASQFAEESDDFVNSRMSEILSSITAGKYDDLSLEDSKQLYLTEDYTKRKPEQYSQATMQQMYFAYRMAAGEMLSKEEPLPFLFDEAFGSYDESRLNEVLSWLSKQERQALIFTCRRIESMILQEMGVNFSQIFM